MTDASTPTHDDDANRWQLITARDIMRTNLITVSYAAPLSQIEEKLGEHGISGAPVVDEAGHIVGVISMKDLIAHYAEDADARPRRDEGYFEMSSEDMGRNVVRVGLPKEAEATASDLMNAEVYFVGPDAGLREIATLMAKKGIHRVFVKEDDRFVGLISTTEIVHALSA